MKHKFLILCLSLGICLCSCQQRTQHASQEGDTIEMKYAQLLTLIQHDGWVEAIIRSPWDSTQTLANYEIRQPLTHAAVFSSVHMALIEELGAGDAIAGVCDPEYISSSFIHEGLTTGRIKNLGQSFQPDVERIAALSPDALLPSAFENAGSYGGIDRLGIPLIPCADYMEVGPLARAEWMRFYGRLFGKGEKADSLFLEVERRYLALKAKAAKVENRPTLIASLPYQGTWNVAGGRSTMGLMYADAGADYVFASQPESGSVPMSLENVLMKGSEADMWLFTYNSPHPITLAQLKSDNPLYAQFHAWQTGNVWGANSHDNRFYEETPFHPDRLLANLISIVHPELEIENRYNYYTIINYTEHLP